MPDNSPQFPLYIPSKGRSAYMLTSKALTKMGVRHYVIVEPHEVDEYQKSIKSLGLSAIVLPLDMSYKTKYELCDDFGLTKSTGPGPARNFAWDHAIAAGHFAHWVMDDNIRCFYRLNKNLKIRCYGSAFWRAMGDFFMRYENLAMIGPNYAMFIPRCLRYAAFRLNTRIYSCNLIRNDLPYRWRGRYNEDTILSLDLLKAGWCTVQFNAFLQEKICTQTLPGGNTAEFYHAEGLVRSGQRYADTGTIAKSKMLVSVHPDLSKLVYKFNRWHHNVDYSPFKNRRLIRKQSVKIDSIQNEYGMKLIFSGAE